MAARLLSREVTGASFSVYSDDDIRRLSVKRITNPVTFTSLNHAASDGLYDRALGPIEFGVLCPTCGLTTQECPGHAGHIELSVPVLNVLFFPTLFRLLRLKCFACHRLRIPASRSRVLKVKLMLLDCGRLEDALALDMRLAARPNAVAEMASAAVGSLRKRGADADEPEDAIDAELARQAAMLRDLEIECVAARGIDVGCGFDPDSATASSQFSQTVRAYRAAAIADFLANVPPKTCANCSAATVAVSKNGYSKIFRKRLGTNAAARMDALGIKYQDASSVLRMRADKGASASGGAVGKGLRASVGVGASHATSEDDEAAPGDGEPVTQHLMPVSEIAAHMQLLWETEAGLLRRAFFPVRTNGGSRARALLAEPTDGWKALFLRVLPVPPSRFRPPTRLGESSFEHPQNVYYSKIIKLSNRMLELSATSEKAVADAGGVDMAALMGTWIALQDAVNGLLDASKAPTTNGKEPPNGVRQLLEKKEGLFRQNMMGKRVNYAARTVISPDPYLRVDQVGVPLHFATSLHFKQGVTSWNYSSLAQAVRNGPHKWPGATHIEYENGRVVDLTKVSQSQRDSFARTLLVTAGSEAVNSGAAGGHAALTQASDADVGAAAAAAASGGLQGVGVKRVWRHMIDGDIVLMNRQPSLHKASVMAHKVRVMKNWSQQQIFRFHYANCKSYNADFDGDEMNMHLPQDHVSRAEAFQIVSTSQQYLSATGAQPLRGLIQDHNAVSVILTARDMFFSRDQFCQLLFSGLQALPSFGVGSGSGGFGAGTDILNIVVPTPAVLKPRRLWTGKQIISTMLSSLSAHIPGSRGLFFEGKAKVPDGVWGEGRGRKDILPVSDAVVTIRSNELLTGVLDKNSLGNTSYGFIHAVFEILGAEAAATLLSALGRLLTVYLQVYAQTCGMSDLTLSAAAEAERSRLIKASTAMGFDAASSHCNGKSSTGSGPSDYLRFAVRSKLRGGAAGADTSGATAAAAGGAIDNVLMNAMSSGHTAVIEACLPHGLAKSFPANQFSLMVTTGAKGSQINHAMIAVGLGQQVLEGRRVPTTAAGKSLPCFPAFDPAPRAGGYISDRFLTGLRPQDYFFRSSP